MLVGSSFFTIDPKISGQAKVWMGVFFFNFLCHWMRTLVFAFFCGRSLFQHRSKNFRCNFKEYFFVIESSSKILETRGHQCFFAEWRNERQSNPRKQVSSWSFSLIALRLFPHPFLQNIVGFSNDFLTSKNFRCNFKE